MHSIAGEYFPSPLAFCENTIIPYGAPHKEPQSVRGSGHSEGNPQISGLEISGYFGLGIHRSCLRVSPQGLVWSVPTQKEMGLRSTGVAVAGQAPAGTLHSLHSGHMSIQFTFIQRSLCYLLDGSFLGEKACGLVPARPERLGTQDSSQVSWHTTLTQSGGLSRNTPRTHRHTIPPSFKSWSSVPELGFFQLQSTCGSG